MAIKSNRTSEINKLLKTINPNCSCKCEEDPRTPMGTAAYYGRLDIAKQLFANGAKVTFRDRRDASALMIAAGRGHFVLTKYLIEKGAHVNRNLNDDGTPLIAAI